MATGPSAEFEQHELQQYTQADRQVTQAKISGNNEVTVVLHNMTLGVAPGGSATS